MKMLTKVTIILVIAVAIVDNAIAAGFKFTPEVCKKYGLGKNWYCGSQSNDQDLGKDTEIEDILNSNLPGEKKAELLEGLRELHTKRAVMDGRQEDIDKAVRIQGIFAKKVIEYAKVAQRTVDSDPKLAVTHSNFKYDTEEAMAGAELEGYLREGSKRYVLVMIYNANCGSCQAQLPKILRMKEKWGFRNLGISVTEEHFEGFDESLSDSEVAKDGSIIKYPTLVVLDTNKQEKIFLSNGITQVEEMEERLVALIKERK
jgi:thiol-disulfide isomerase/thioredoxin